jgi:hypothetical protein
VRCERGLPIVRRPPERTSLGRQGLYPGFGPIVGPPERTHAVDAATDEALCGKPRGDWHRVRLDWETLPPDEQCPGCRRVFDGA